MTIRRYYDDSWTWRFDATVTEAGGGPDAPWAVLDATWFYPTSGGQPHDTGRLGAARVLDVTIRESDGAVVHRLDAAIAPGPVSASIDGDRRLDHMQQHSGQHILSQAFVRVAGAATIGFHLGAETISIDLDATDLPESLVAEAVELANRVIGSNLPVRAWFPSPDELDALALRKLPDVHGPVRVVAIGDFDLSACGGTHVSRSGDIGLLAVLRTERLKRGTRVEFLCGHRARADYARKHGILRDLSRTLTCAPDELTAAVSRMSAALEESRRALRHYQERELDDEAEELLSGAMARDGLRVVARNWPDRPIEDVKGLATRLTAAPGVVALLAVGGTRTQVLFARSEGLEVDLKPVFERTLQSLGGGKGGGGRLLQGAAGAADGPVVAAALQAAADAVRKGAA